MKSTFQLLTLLLTSLLASAQSILPAGASGNFPACAVSCAVLQQAQSTCETQTGQQTTGLAAENCFCQSATLQGLYSTPDALCVAECPTASDRVNLRTWFMSFCAQVGQGVDPNASNSATATTADATNTNTAAPTATRADGTIVSNQNRNQESWISGHWQWIVMIIVLAIGLGGLAWLLIFLRNRHRRKLDERRAQLGGFPNEREKAAGARAATPDLWGPHQHMNATQGYEYPEKPTAAAAVPRERQERSGRHERSEKRHSRRNSFKPGSKTREPLAEVQEPPSSTQRGHSSKGKHRGDVDAIQQQRDPSQSRSRSRKPPRTSKYDFDRDIENI